MEINTPEIYDPSHLSPEELDCIKRMVEARQAGVEDAVEDDPIARGLVNGYIMTTIGQSVEEPGYEKMSGGEKVESSDKADTGTDSLERNKAKLFELVSMESFNLALAAAKELDPKLQLPDDARVQIIEKIIQLSPERVQEICGEMQKPTLIIIPANTFEKKIKQMNKNTHYENQNGAYVADGSDEPFRKVVTIDKVRVCIVEGIPHPKQQEDAPLALGKRRIHEIERLASKNMKLAGVHGVATLLQQSLIEAEQTGDNGKIVDNWEDGNETETILNPEELTDSPYVAYARFLSNLRQARFSYYIPYFEGDNIRGRALVQVLEF